MNNERLWFSDGSWHRLQRKRVAFETSCYYTAEPELPYGCQYEKRLTGDWKNDFQRDLEKSVLWDFFVKTNGGNWRANDNWDPSLDPCWDTWYGITCDEHGHVISLELSDNKLSGDLTYTMLGNLVSLLKLDLSSTAPDWNANENALANRLYGQMPSMAGCTRLEEIEVSGNQITALPPDLYKNGATLRVLSASHNLLKSWPQILPSFTALHTLELSNNNIQDFFTPDFGSMINLRYVHLQYNLLQGEVPESLINLQHVINFDLSHNTDLGGEMQRELVPVWEENDYIAIMNTSITGYLSELCLDIPFCWRFMYDTHKAMTWATASDVPDVVKDTLKLAQANSVSGT